jgi:hypothetical protein
VEERTLYTRLNELFLTIDEKLATEEQREQIKIFEKGIDFEDGDYVKFVHYLFASYVFLTFA